MGVERAMENGSGKEGEREGTKGTEKRGYQREIEMGAQGVCDNLQS